MDRAKQLIKCKEWLTRSPDVTPFDFFYFRAALKIKFTKRDYEVGKSFVIELVKPAKKLTIKHYGG